MLIFYETMQKIKSISMNAKHKERRGLRYADCLLLNNNNNNMFIYGKLYCLSLIMNCMSILKYLKEKLSHYLCHFFQVSKALLFILI